MVKPYSSTVPLQLAAVLGLACMVGDGKGLESAVSLQVAFAVSPGSHPEGSGSPPPFFARVSRSYVMVSLCFQDRVSLCIPGCPGTHSCRLGWSWTHRDLLAFASLVHHHCLASEGCFITRDMIKQTLACSLLCRRFIRKNYQFTS